MTEIQRRIAGYLEHPQCDVLAVCDVDAVVASEAAQRWGVPTVYSDMDKLLERLPA